jgi:hypothetical protein
MFQRPGQTTPGRSSPQMSKPQVETSVPEWSPAQLAGFLDSLTNQLPEGRNKAFFQVVRNELVTGAPRYREPGKYEILLHPISGKEAETPIILDRFLLPESLSLDPITVMTRDGSRNFRIPGKIEGEYITFSDGKVLLTYTEAYERLGLPNISSLRLMIDTR